MLGKGRWLAPEAMQTSGNGRRSFLVYRIQRYRRRHFSCENPAGLPAAYRKLEAYGYAPAVIEQLNTGVAYNLAYSRTPLKRPESATSELKRKPDVNIQGEPCERFVTERSSAAQNKFKTLLIENFAGRCAVTGWVNGGVLVAAHIEHGTRYNPSNGILLTPTMHALFDADLMGIDPSTLTVHFKPGIEAGELFEGKTLNPLVYDLEPTGWLLAGLTL